MACIEQFLRSSVISVGNSQSCSFRSNQHKCNIILSDPGSIVSACVMEVFAGYQECHVNAKQGLALQQTCLVLMAT